MKQKKLKKGFYWHVHHDRLLEWCYNYDERVDYIKTEKPEKEIKTRLKLFKKVKGKLPKEIIEVRERYDEARERYDEASERGDEARERYVEARERYVEARERYMEVSEKCKKQIEKLHNKECGCKEWNGKEIVFEK